MIKKGEITHFFSLHNYLAVVKVKVKVRARNAHTLEGADVGHSGILNRPGESCDLSGSHSGRYRPTEC